MSAGFRIKTIVALFLLGIGCWAHPAKKDNWIEIKSPNFTIVSNAGEKSARSLIRDCEIYRALIRQVLPGIKSDPGIPTIIIAVKNRKDLKVLLPQYWEQEDQFHPAGLFVSGMDRNYIPLRIDFNEEERSRLLFHEYVHLLVHLNLPPLPTWLNEGLAEFYGHTSQDGKSSKVGLFSSRQIKILTTSELFPLPELLVMDHGGLVELSPDRASVVYAQSWALTHYFLIHEKGQYADQLWTYLGLIQKGMPSAEAAPRAFGDLTKLQEQLHRYVRRNTFFYLKADTPQIPDAELYPVCSLDNGQLAVLMGDFYVHIRRWVEAEAALDEARQLKPDDPGVYESLGVLYKNREKLSDADKYFRKAIDLGSESFLAYYYAGEGAQQYDSDEKAESFYRRALELNPRFAQTYLQLARILSTDSQRSEEALSLVRKAVQMEPGILSHQIQLGYVLLNLRRLEEASRLSEQLQRAARSKSDQRMATQLAAAVLRQQEFLRGPGNQVSSVHTSGKTAVEKDGAYTWTYSSSEYTDGNKPEVTLGIITDVSCPGPGRMEFLLDSDSGSFIFLVEDLSQLRFEINGDKTKYLKTPCPDMKGLKVMVVHKPVENKVYDGAALEILVIGEMSVSD